MVAIVASLLVGPAWPDSLTSPFLVVGAVLVAAGGVLGALAFRALGKALTPFPRPATGGGLVERGPYRFVRHPLYSAGLLVFTGLALAFSPVAVGLTALLGVVWGLKVQVEERFLRGVYPEYEAYASRTRYRLVPFVY